ncbi:DUF6985 domain-containing protein [Bacillus pseudomycoides]|uniref:DUF6985 domain-containing protein n=1 Tax=Bacillus pseudomycoides TaxID=64104 RepID=UPI000BEB8719|nr:DUF2004 domain-containing protein [Bacillus pseudomycoides]PEA81204.1 DUF2004 domain-containing protein [Bacillus pseudomycoides]PED08484.1 DUF2004 domain-containing protein [Bacillus pseudomycoides]PEI99788.1 DUF2004 domain-containing protein [Bacillus pseudomycoides]PEK09471.1 DUF2004 domain-containing protein [Bacillus pseudomycoides]PEM74503.1 DUF2004 domain-containing protein [Bacillus pseudomycoides]
MVINDEVFGELDYQYIWLGYRTVKFLGKDIEIALLVGGTEDGEFDEGQYAAYNSLIHNWEQIQHSILHSILDYYKQKRHELGYDVAFNEEYPLIETVDQLIEHIILVGISVPYDFLREGRDIGISFDCSWDEENGLGVRLINEKVDEIGYQDVAV